jgi:beta-glucosidase
MHFHHLFPSFSFLLFLSDSLFASSKRIQYANQHDFAWGVATAAYQIEGAHNQDGRSPSIWDKFSHSGRILSGENGDVATDHYHRWHEDVQLMKKLGVQSYRFSISWTRVLPDGSCSVPGDLKTCNLNDKGVEYYTQLIDALLEAGIEPYVTIYHWDLPQILLDRYNGWLSPNVVQDYIDYATLLFQTFGGKVNNWITFNEPYVFCTHGYKSGLHAPGWLLGDKKYLCGHHVLQAHAKVVDIFRKEYKRDGGRIGLTMNAFWYEPYDTNIRSKSLYSSSYPLCLNLKISHLAGKEAAQRAVEFELGWFADPIHLGDYPPVMRERLGKNLPEFTPEEKQLLKGSSDFFGLNHYTTWWAMDNPLSKHDKGVIPTPWRPFRFIGPKADGVWLFVVPWGFRKLLNWISERYSHPSIIITENGVSAPKEHSNPVTDVLNDDFRVSYFRDYLSEMKAAMEQDNVNIAGYFAWSLLDNFEWTDGYSKRFGLIYVDYKNNCTRHVKKSAYKLSAYFNDGTAL